MDFAESNDEDAHARKDLNRKGDLRVIWRKAFAESDQFGKVTCCRWWKTFDGRDYLIMGTDAGYLKFINVDTCIEVCGCGYVGRGSCPSLVVHVTLFIC